MHAVDKDALEIWFRFYPFALEKYLDAADDIDEARRGVAMQGKFGLADSIDTSHEFLYGHRYWKTVKAAIIAEAGVFDGTELDLDKEIESLSDAIAERLKVDASLTLAITSVGLMTLAQVGFTAFKATEGDVAKPSGIMAKPPQDIIAVRSKDDSQGILGFLKTVNKKFSVTFDESGSVQKFPVMADQEIASASALDRSQKWQEKDERCWEGPVPVECLAASCGTCWVGVIGGKDKLTPVARREKRQLKVFGYSSDESDNPSIRLACQARATGNVSIVIPPWNAVFGKKVYGNVEDVDLQPPTSSAKVLRNAEAETDPA